jgi:hypothetical protein
MLNWYPRYPPEAVTGVNAAAGAFKNSEAVETTAVVVNGGGSTVRLKMLEAVCPA